MPQLDTLTYFSQLFWLILIFISFYFINFKYLQNLDSIFKIRNKFKHGLSSTSSFTSSLNYPSFAIKNTKGYTINSLNEFAKIHKDSLLVSYQLFIEGELNKKK